MPSLQAPYTKAVPFLVHLRKTQDSTAMEPSLPSLCLLSLIVPVSLGPYLLHLRADLSPSPPLGIQHHQQTEAATAHISYGGLLRLDFVLST